MHYCMDIYVVFASVLTWQSRILRVSGKVVLAVTESGGNPRPGTRVLNI